MLGILVNFFEYLVRTLLAPEIFGTFEENFLQLFACDIYFFAALSSLVLAFTKLFEPTATVTVKAWFGVFASMTLVVICEAIRAILGFEGDYVESDVGDVVLDLFIRESVDSYFPFTSWIIFPVVGYFAALLYKLNSESSEPKNIFKVLSYSGIVALLISNVIMGVFDIPNAVLWNDYHDGYYYAMDISGALFSLGVIAIELAVFNLLMKFIKTVPQFVSNASRNIMTIYIFQWMIIGTFAPQIYFVESILDVVIISTIILIAICIFAEFLRKFKKRFLLRK